MNNISKLFSLYIISIFGFSKSYFISYDARIITSSREHNSNTIEHNKHKNIFDYLLVNELF